MHKYAGELTQGDLFQMAGGLYRILNTYQVDNEDKIKIAFDPVDGTVAHNVTHLIIDRDILFHLW